MKLIAGDKKDTHTIKKEKTKKGKFSQIEMYTMSNACININVSK